MDTSSLEKSGGLVPLSELEFDERPRNPYGEFLSDHAIIGGAVKVSITFFSKGVHVVVEDSSQLHTAQFFPTR